MIMYKLKIGIICGSGLDGLAKRILKNYEQLDLTSIKNDFGVPSSCIYLGMISNVEVALIARHGLGHKISPTNVNYRANIEALKLIGCTHILASTACGSLSESFEKGQLVVPDSFIDRTRNRIGTLFDGTSDKYKGVCHIPMEPSFHPKMIDLLVKAGQQVDLNIKKGGTIVTIEGPRFSSKAESKAFQMWGGHLINMTTCPEVCIAKEAGLIYGSVAMVTDYDCWKESEKSVCVDDVMIIFKKNVNKIEKLFVKAIELISKEEWNQHIDDLKIMIENGNVTLY